MMGGPATGGLQWPESHVKALALHHVDSVCVCVCVCVGCSVMSDSLGLHGLQPTRFLCPWNFPGKNTGIGSHSLLQGIFPTQGSNSGLLQADSLPFDLSGKPLVDGRNSQMGGSRSNL